jgi:ubiquinone/menaquinone biosynthesis C-methylase UbiE
MGRDNARLNRIAIELLDVGHGDRVLEIGFGTGEAIEYLVRYTAAQYIAGIDPSDVMVDNATGRNKEAIDAGRVLLLPGVVEDLPLPEARFSKVFAVCNFHMWQSRRKGLEQIRRVLVKEGLLAICLRKARARHRWFARPGVTPEEIAGDLALLKAEGFRDVRTVERNVGQGVVCLLAQR